MSDDLCFLSAAAVASGIAPLAVATDGGGSRWELDLPVADALGRGDLSDMQQSNSCRLAELDPPPKRPTPPSEQTDEAPGLVESDQVEIEREAPLDENEPVEGGRRDKPDSEPPAFEE